MEKYRNNKTGTEGVVRDDNHLHYELEAGNIVALGTIPMILIKHSDDWDLMEEDKPFEVMQMINSDGQVGTPQQDGKFSICEIYSKRKGHKSLEEMQGLGYKIATVKRNSDEEIFTLGDLVRRHADEFCSTPCTDIQKIESLNFYENENNNVKFRNSEGFEPFFLPYFSKVKPVFTSHDGVEICKGDTLFLVNKNNWVITNLSYFRRDTPPFTGKDNSFVYFSCIEAAELYRSENKFNFMTEDGKEIRENDTYWCVNTAPHLWSLFEQTAKKNTILTKGVKAFSTKDRASTYRFMNEPRLSINDIVNFKSVRLREGVSYMTLDAIELINRRDKKKS